MSYSASIYNVVRAFEFSDSPLTLSNIMKLGEIKHTDADRGKVLDILDKLVECNLIGFICGKFRHDGYDSYTIIPHRHTGITLTKPNNELESLQLLGKLCVMIEYYIEFNNDLEAYKLLCNYLIIMGKPAKSLLDRFIHIETLYNMDGYMCTALGAYRGEVVERLLQLSKLTLPENYYLKIWESF